MENRRQKSSSGEIFSFPSTPNQDQDSDFEFGCLTPDWPSSDPCKNSPADHLFFNGKLLPHSFPVQPTIMVTDMSRATSRTSSVSSKDSLMSSRSNSTNSRSSSCGSARTSSSDNSERKLLYYNKVSCKTPVASKLVTNQLYGSSQRWQYITPVPALKREASRRKNGGVVGKEGLSVKKDGGERTKARESPCRRFFRSFFMACRECHAMEPSTKDDVLQGNVKLK